MEILIILLETLENPWFSSISKDFEIFDLQDVPTLSATSSYHSVFLYHLMIQFLPIGSIPQEKIFWIIYFWILSANAYRIRCFHDIWWFGEIDARELTVCREVLYTNPRKYWKTQENMFLFLLVFKFEFVLMVPKVVLDNNNV